jgi:trigger factor
LHREFGKVTIKTVETQNEGLKRGFMLTIPAADIEARVDREVKRIAPQVRMPGFRPGKVPPNLIRKMHGDSLQRDALQGAVQDGVQQLLVEQNVRPALQPQIELDEQYEPGKDAEVRVSLEALPNVPLPSIDDLKLERLTVETDETAVDQQIEQLAAQSKAWKDAPKSHAAAAGDLVVMDFDGKVGGKAFDGGQGEDMSVELGSGRLIPGFEDQLLGVKAGDEREVKLSFPSDYPAANLAGKKATFAVSVKAVKVAGETKVDDAFAKTLGLQDLDQLKGLIRDQQAQELNGLTRTHMKRQLLDQLAARHDFAVPESMVEAEFENILNQLRHEASHEADPQAALAEIEKDADDYRHIAERRVRLGLLLSEIGAANGVEVTEQEMNRLIAQAASQYQGKDRENFIAYVQREPLFAAQLRAPLYEDKVVDFLFSQSDVSERTATRAQIEADLESEEGHVHGPGCGHDHAAPAKSAKGGAKTKGASKQPIPTKAKAETKKADIVEKAAAPKPAKPLKSEPANAAAAKAVAKAAPKAKAEAKPAPKGKAAAKPAAKSEAKPSPKAAPKPKAEAKPAPKANAAAKPAAKKAAAKKK